MVTLVIALVFGLLALFCFKKQAKLEEEYRAKKYGRPEDTLEGFGVFFSIICTVASFITLLLIPIGYVNNLSDTNSISQYKANEVIYNQRAVDLTHKFTELLAIEYPNFEKNIYNKISPSNVDIYLVKYPELRSSETILALVNQIRDLRDSIYNQELAINQKIKDIRTRHSNPMFIPWLDATYRG